jgi:hypothetical protein
MSEGNLLCHSMCANYLSIQSTYEGASKGGLEYSGKGRQCTQAFYSASIKAIVDHSLCGLVGSKTALRLPLVWWGGVGMMKAQ